MTVARKSNVMMSVQVSKLYKGIPTSPALAHSATFAPPKTPRVRRTASQADTETMGQFVNNNAGLKIAIAVRVRGIPQVHPAPTVLPVGGSHKVGIIISGTVLGICDDRIPFHATTSEVVLLEVAGDFVEAITGYDKPLRHFDGDVAAYKTYR